MYRNNKINIYFGSKESFTENKKNIFICSSKNKNIQNYVLLHEMAHVISSNYGHTKNFNKIFSELLEEAIKENIIDKENITNKNIKIYCDICNCN